MFTRVDISVVPWQRRGDKSIFNILSLFSPTFLPRIHFEDLWLGKKKLELHFARTAETEED